MAASVSDMSALELKIPPPIVALVLAISMWGISLFTPAIEDDTIVRISVSVIIALIGVGFSVAGVIAFRRAKTTLNPNKPADASSLVTGGIYRVTRNPMYVGVLIVLVSWAGFLDAPWTLIAPAVFFAYISRYQITPEEKILSSIFGDAYSKYKANVRRWL